MLPLSWSTVLSAASDHCVRVFAPATVSNVGPGFDSFGFALETPGDVVMAVVSDTPGVRIATIEGDDGSLPTDPASNTASVAAAAVWNAQGDLASRLGLELRIGKGLPPGSGLGSSAASAVAGALAAMHLAARVAGARHDGGLVLDAALQGEAVAAGARHADNVAPCLLGGFTVVQSGDPPSVARFQPALDCWIAAVLPALTIATREARAVLPSSVPLTDAVANWSNAAGLIVGLLTADAAIVRRSLVDYIVEPCRAPLIPGFDVARRSAVEAGALACSISGAGPALFALATSRAGAEASAQAVAGAFSAVGLASRSFVSPLSPAGATLR